LFHAALTAAMPKPVAVLNIGGVAKVTWIGERAEILAFDTGPGNALIDDWVRRRTGAPADFAGALARAGRVSAAHVEGFLARPFFDRAPPKSLDRDDFRDAVLTDLSLEDGAATLTRDDRRRSRRGYPLFSGTGTRVARNRLRAAQPGSVGGPGPAS